MEVRKAVITAAGLGTRFLPATKTQPKEMLPLVDRPLIQYAVEEAAASGIEQIVIVTRLSKRGIEEHFKRSFELEYALKQRGELGLLAEVRRISELADICYVRQTRQLGLGHAILMVKDFVGDEPFAILLPDDIIEAKVPAMRQMMEVYQRYKGSVVAVERVAKENLGSYGIIKPKQIDERVYQVLGLVEKPEPEQAPSNLGIVGRYILTPEIFSVLQRTPPGKGGEIQLTDALQLLLQQQAVYACGFEGRRHDAGTPLGFMKASVELALRRPDIGEALRHYLRGLGL